MGSVEVSDLDPRTQLIPNLVDYYAASKPDALYAEYPMNPMSFDDGYRKITYKAFANAINGLAHWLTETLGPGNGEVLCYVGPNDLRYPALVLGAVKAGYCMFLTSPRNSIAAHKSLLERLECTTFLTPVPRPPFVGPILEGCSVKGIDIPSLETLLTTEYPHFEFNKTYPKAGPEPIAFLHTSGSTGVPKPIKWTHESAATHMRMNQMEIPEGCEGQDRKGFGKRLYMTMPPFHAAGIGFVIFVTIPVNITLIMPTSGSLPTAAGLVAARKQTPFDWALVVPSIVLELAQDPELLDYCTTHLEYIVYGGGDLPQAIGNKVAAKIPLMNGYGASELGIMNVIHTPDRDPLEDWRYLQFNPELGVELRHVSGEEYEAVVVRTPARQAYQFPFTIFPDRQEYHTNDLMVCHPTKPNLWRPSGRLDDVIVFLNGEKTNPISFEQEIVSAHPEVTGCLVVGAQRFQASLIIELAGSKDLSVNERAEMIEKLWPSIEEANIPTPAHARIAKSHIIFTSPEKPILRAGKGTVQRAGTLILYAQEIENMYADADKLAELDANHQDGPGGVDDAAKVAEYIKTSILAITGWNPESFNNEHNWFNLGLDSLQAITATRVLKRGLNLQSLTPNVIYLNPTVVRLTQALQNLHQISEESTEAKNQALIQERDQLLQELIGQIKITEAQKHEESPVTHSVILTGSTGQLGTYLLNALTKSPQVEHVYCLDRDDHARDRQRDRSAAYGLAPADEARVSFWKADLSQADFGLQQDQLEKLQEQATLIIHNAWPVNFNLSLASFKPTLTGVVNLINFSSQAIRAPRLLFISSISSILGHQTENGLIPETVITTTTPAPNGYANSKYISEHLLAYAAQQGLPHPAFARVGQVAGPIRYPGLWNKSEWFPSVVLSSLHLGALPDSLGQAMDRVDWVPVDLLAEILVEVAVINNSGLTVYHPVNLNPKSWKEIQPFVTDALQKVFQKTMETISLRDWVLRVRKDVEAASQGDKVLKEAELQAHLAKNPAAKLLEFFEGLVANTAPESVLDTQNTAQASEKVRAVDAVKPEWVEKWVGEWLQ
ncbi:NRPS-like enzyme [Penicillium malachiteum]|uniref:NRPS-like enzyme n=1 Tax=Penicillium malachiteum TaxID=1324776 RepID=A0AAD6MW91_9EURO|nr:NRPS-like enzyme [Penicillium malachiteum]